MHKANHKETPQAVEPVVHDADLERRWWYDDERPKYSAPRQDHDVRRQCLLSLLTPPPFNGRPRSLIRP